MAQRDAKWTNARVADAAGTTLRNVYRWKRGKNIMRGEHVIRLQRELPGFLELSLKLAS